MGTNEARFAEMCVTLQPKENNTPIMNIEEYIIARVNALLQATDASIVKRLEGGMSNYTYVVDCGGKRYTYRVPGKSAEHFVDRADEWKNILAVEPLGLNNENSYVELRTGEKLADYVEGTILTDTDIVSYNELSAKTLHKIHESGVKFSDYDAFGRLERYEGYCREKGFAHPESYVKLRQHLDKCREQIGEVEKVPCHCDYQPSNLVVSPDGLKVLDWEFAGMNDPLYDVACYGNAGFDKALSLLEAYVGHEPTADEKRRLYFHRAFQCMQWYNVAIFKHLIGLSKDLNMDFSDVATFFFNMATDLLGEYDKL